MAASQDSAASVLMALMEILRRAARESLPAPMTPALATAERPGGTSGTRQMAMGLMLLLPLLLKRP